MILYGKPVACAIEQELVQKIEELKKKDISPAMVVILVGDDPASILYTKKKKEKAEKLGIGFKLCRLSKDISEENLIELINDFNKNKLVHGIVVQLPLPENFDTAKVLAQISVEKDVDGLNGGCPPPAAGAVLEILDFYKIDLKGKKIVLVGRGKLVGAPLEKILSAQGLEPLVLDSKTEDLAEWMRDADIIVSGVGKPNLIQADMVSEKAIIIDAGTAESNGTTVGDVAPAVYEKIASYSPVPGGVGPVTVARLLKNLVSSTEKFS